MVKLLSTTLIDLIWVAQASLASMAAISIQDDANVARHRPLFELIEESALVNPIKKTYKRRGSRAVVRRPSLLGSLPSVEPGRGRRCAPVARGRKVAGRACAGRRPWHLATEARHHLIA